MIEENENKKPETYIIEPTEPKNSNSDYEQLADQYDNFPPKPVEARQEKSIHTSIISFLLFFGAFYFLFKWDIQSIIALSVVLFIHELGHYLAMRIYNYKDLGMFFIPLLGAFVTGEEDKVSQKQRTIILLAGPLPGIIIGIALFFIGLNLNNPLLLKASNIFIFLNLFNLLPMMPLDGGKVIKTMFFDSNEIINTVFVVLSIILLSLLAFFQKSYIFLLIPVFLAMQLNTQMQIEKTRKSLKKINLDLNKTYKELTNREYWQIRAGIVSNMKVFSDINPNDYSYSHKEPQIFNMLKQVINKKPLNDIGFLGKTVITLIWILSFIVPIAIIIL
ncbi:MAG: site-2 protease family protein [Bacteroidota bacterium]